MLQSTLKPIVYRTFFIASCLLSVCLLSHGQAYTGEPSTSQPGHPVPHKPVGNHSIAHPASQGLPLYYWRQPHMVNFGDYISLKLVERIVGHSVRVYQKNTPEKKLLAIGSILSFANDHDVVWGSGINGKLLNPKDYVFKNLDVRAVRGPLTKYYLENEFGIKVPSIYGDPALLFPLLFPEFKRKQNPTFDFIIIPHYSEIRFFPKSQYPNVVYPTEPWDQVISKILDSKFVISSSLHGIIIAEAYGIPARLLRITENERIFKYLDYYMGTGRYDFKSASSVEEALVLGGEKPIKCDLKKLYFAFPFDLWPNLHPKQYKFQQHR